MLLCDGFGVAMDLGSPRAKRSAFFGLNLNMKDPESIAGKIMIEYTVTVIIGLLPKSTCKFLHPDIGILFPKHYTPLHYITLHYTTFRYTSVYITLHYTPLHYNYTCDYTTTLHYTPLHEITLHYTTFHYTPVHYTTLHYATLH